MSCTDLSSPAGSVIIERNTTRTDNNDPKFIATFDSPVPINATRFTFTDDKGREYTVKIGCAFETGEEVLIDQDIDSIVWQSGNTVRYSVLGDLDLVEVGDILNVSGATNDENNGQFQIDTVGETAIIGSLDIDTITWIVGTSVELALNGTPDLSGVKVGMVLEVVTATNASNNGRFLITDVDDGTDTITIDNPSRTDGTDDEATDSPAVGEVNQIHYEVTNTGITDATYDKATTSAIYTIYSGEVLYFFELPIGWNEDLLSCGVTYTATVDFYECTEDPCCAGGDPIIMSIEAIDSDFGVSPSDNVLTPNSSPLNGYEAMEIDETGDPRYYGFQNADGSYYLVEIDGTAGTETVRYSKGTQTDLTTDWSNRTTLTYDTFENVF